VTGLAEVALGVALELLQDEGADLLGGEVLAVEVCFQSVPTWRLTDRMVRSTLVTAWRLATSPTSTSPFLAKATIDGVVRAPSALAMTRARRPRGRRRRSWWCRGRCRRACHVEVPF
jgi:hypothetical protein